MSKVESNSRNRPAHPEPDGSLGPYCDGSLGPYYNERFHTTLTNVWRRRRLVIATVAVALAIGIVIALTMPKQYTAEAYVREPFKAEEATLRTTRPAMPSA